MLDVFLFTVTTHIMSKEFIGGKEGNPEKKKPLSRDRSVEAASAAAKSKVHSLIGNEAKESSQWRYERIETSEDPYTEAAHDLLMSPFKDSEKDPLEVTTHAIDHEGYVVVAAKGKSGEVGAAISAAANPLRLAGKEEMGDLAFANVCYLVSETNELRDLVALYKKMVEEVKYEAGKEGKQVIGTLTEASGEDLKEEAQEEKLYNRIGAKRVYVKTGVNSYEEVPYFQPPTTFDDQGKGISEKEDGTTEEFGRYSAPEHLMFAPLGENTQSVPKEQMLGMVRGMWQYNSRDNFTGSPEGKKTMHALIDGYEEEIGRQIMKGDDQNVYLLSERERRALEKQGAKFINHEKHPEKK